MMFFIRALAVAIVMSLAATTFSLGHEIKAGDLNLTELWSRATPSGAKVAAAYLTIENRGSAPDRLIGIATPAGNAQIHEMTTTNGVMTMRPVEGGLAIAPGQKLTLAPGGIHLMLTDLKGPLKEGEVLRATLQFEKAGQVDATFHIRSVGAQGPGDAARPGQMDHKGMKM